MLSNNTLKPTATIVAALILGAMMALLAVVAPAPAQAAPGDELRLLSLKAIEITHDEGGLLGDFVDEPYIKVDGVEVWSGRSDPLRMKDGDVRNLTGISRTLSGQSARVQLWESDSGVINRPDDGPAEFFADYTGGDERTRTLQLNGGIYELTYVVDEAPDVDPPETTISAGPGNDTKNGRAAFEFFADEPASFECRLDSGVFEPCSSPKVYSGLTEGDYAFEVRAIDLDTNVDTSPATRRFSVTGDELPVIGAVKPAPGSAIRDRTPLIAATVKDDLTDLGQANMTLAVDGRAKSFAYNATTDRLLYQSGRLAYGKHSVKVSATDSAGQKAEKVWTFRVVRR